MSEDRNKEKTVKTAEKKKVSPEPKEVGGSEGPEPTRYGDWEKKGITSDF
tara:strand:+ start:990 stop:1139 length:150 start_codon:yes stop_codon:yes gene_type:complete